jgi:hypothetical protein
MDSRGLLLAACNSKAPVHVPYMRCALNCDVSDRRRFDVLVAEVDGYRAISCLQVSPGAQLHGAEAACKGVCNQQPPRHHSAYASRQLDDLDCLQHVIT